MTPTEKQNLKILQLNLKKQWFDMILSGQKREEYREDKPYWQNRLLLKEKDMSDIFSMPAYIAEGISEYAHYDAIQFSNGYAKNRPQMLVELKGIEIGIGNKDWGAPDYEVFKLKLGQILETKNC